MKNFPGGKELITILNMRVPHASNIDKTSTCNGKLKKKIPSQIYTLLSRCQDTEYLWDEIAQYIFFYIGTR